MKIIPIVITETETGELISPAAPFSTDAIAIVCDGTKYTIYEPGDTPPDLL